MDKQYTEKEMLEIRKTVEDTTAFRVELTITVNQLKEDMAQIKDFILKAPRVCTENQKLCNDNINKKLRVVAYTAVASACIVIFNLDVKSLVEWGIKNFMR